MSGPRGPVPDGADAVIRARGVTRAFGDARVLDGLDVEIRRGEKVALLGPNGAGKTTFFRCLLGVLDFGGEITVDGLPVASRGKEVRGRIGYVPQNPPAFDLRLDEFLDLFAGLRKADPEVVRARLADLGMDPATEGEKRMRELSGGMLQKAVLALAMGSEPPVVLLDEPTSSLDPRSRRELLRAVKVVAPRRTVLFASHRFDEIEFLAERVLVLHRHAIVFDGSPAELWEAAGLGPRLWLRVPGERIQEVASHLRRRPGVEEVLANGAGLEVQVRPEEELAVLTDLRDRSVPVLEFRSRPPAPDEMLDRILARDEETGSGRGT